MSHLTTHLAVMPWNYHSLLDVHLKKNYFSDLFTTNCLGFNGVKNVTNTFLCGTKNGLPATLKDFLSVYQLGTVNTSTARRLTDDEKPTQMARCKVFVVTTLAAQLWVPNKIIFSLWILTTFHLSNVWCQTSDQNQQSLGFTSEGIIPHSLGNGVCVGGCFCTSTLTASLPVGLGVFVPSCVWSLFNCGPVTYLETSPTYYFSCHQQDDLEESCVKKKKNRKKKASVKSDFRCIV